MRDEPAQDAALLETRRPSRCPLAGNDQHDRGHRLRRCRKAGAPHAPRSGAGHEDRWGVHERCRDEAPFFGRWARAAAGAAAQVGGRGAGGAPAFRQAAPVRTAPVRALEMRPLSGATPGHMGPKLRSSGVSERERRVRFIGYGFGRRATNEPDAASGRPAFPPPVRTRRNSRPAPGRRWLCRYPAQPSGAAKAPTRRPGATCRRSRSAARSPDARSTASLRPGVSGMPAPPIGPSAGRARALRKKI